MIDPTFVICVLALGVVSSLGVVSAYSRRPKRKDIDRFFANQMSSKEEKRFVERYIHGDK